MNIFSFFNPKRLFKKQSKSHKKTTQALNSDKFTGKKKGKEKAQQSNKTDKEKKKIVEEIGTSESEEKFEFVHKKLSGQDGLKIIQEIEKTDPMTKTSLYVIKSLIKKTNVNVHGGSERAASFLSSILDDMGDHFIYDLGRILSFIPYGFSAFEIVYKFRSDNMIGWEKFAFRPQSTLIDNWVKNNNGRLIGVNQVDEEMNEIFLPIEKMLVFSNDFEENKLQGETSLLPVYKHWKKKNIAENVEGIGMERDLAGMPVLYAPPEIFLENATDEERQSYENLKNMLSNIRRDEQEGVMLPAEYDQNGNLIYRLDLLSSGGSRQFDINKIITRQDYAILTSFMTNFIMAGKEGGSYALHKSKSEMFIDSLNEYISKIEYVLNSIAVDRLYKLNGFENEEEYSFLHLRRLNDKNLNEFAKRLSDYASAGFQLFPDEALENHVKEKENIPTGKGGGGDYASQFTKQSE